MTPASHDHDSILPALLPLDEHNSMLRRNTHPTDWVNPEPSGRYNLVVIGAGTAGLVSAAGAAGLGAKVALIERHLTGGDCLNVGCVPSKALIRSARVAHDTRRAAEFGVKVGSVEVDFPAVMERMRRLRAGIAPVDSVHRFKSLGVDVYLGSARFVDARRIEVAGKTLAFARAVIATGARASTPSIPGLAEAGYLTNETVFSLTSLPRRLVVFGGGPIGCELAQAFARFGSKVTVIQSEKQVLPREDPDAAAIVEASLRRDGIDILCGAQSARVALEHGLKVVSVDCAGHSHRVEADEILVAVGRTPNVDGLSLDAAGVKYDPKLGVTVDDQLRTTHPHIFAAGDICSRYKFTHTADALARIVLQNALFFGRSRASALTVPWCTYTAPEIAHVGRYAKDLDAEGVQYETIRIDLEHVDRSILEGETEGFLKVHYVPKKGTILGATLVASHAGDMISEISLAMEGKVGLGTIARTIHPYPTQADVIKRAGDAFNRTKLTPTVKSLFERLLRWRR
jgi:pyruvate/2-oxoglutarate dehydrogenase complex dihydrolipoamide dehydrogenase (E3) component